MTHYLNRTASTVPALITLIVASMTHLHLAHAQDAKPGAEPAEPGQLETVIVTAQRRSENIKDVPMAITTMKGEKLDVLTSGGQDIRFLAGRTPSLNVESSFGRTFPRFYIRGQGNTDFDLNASQPVGLVVDDIVLENPVIKGFPVFDVDQIEVLRGPQGTLFGRNSPAGVIKFESAKPTRNLKGYVNFGIGNYSTVNTEGAFNLPLGPDWAARIALLSQHRGDRVHNNRPNALVKDFEGYDDTAARLQLLYKVRDFSALWNVHHRDYKGNAILFRANIIKKGSNDIVDGFDYASYPTDGGNVQTLQTTGASMRLRWDLDGLTVHSITGYESATYYSRGDVDGGYGAVYAPPMGPGFIPFSAETADGVPDLKQYSQEVRVESNTKGPLQWIAGVYAFKEDITVDSFNFDTPAGSVQHGYAVQHQNSSAWAVFGSLNYAVSEQLKVRGGVRYTNDKKDFDATRKVNPFDNLPGIGPLTAHPSTSNISWDWSAVYAVDGDTNVFGRVATGYRAPSIQGRILFGDTISVANSEKVLSFEAGLKQDFFNKRARMSLSLFQYEVKDLQLTAGNGTVNQNLLVNVDKASGHGAEIDFQAVLTDGLRMSLGGSYNKTEIKDPALSVIACGSGCTITNRNEVLPNGAIKAYINGNPLPRAPRWNANFTLRYGRPVANGELFVYTDWAYRGSSNMFLYAAKEFEEKASLEGGLRVGYKWADGKYEAAVFSRNITNRRQLTGALDFNNLTGIVNEPRTIGVQFKANF